MKYLIDLEGNEFIRRRYAIFTPLAPYRLSTVDVQWESYEEIKEAYGLHTPTLTSKPLKDYIRGLYKVTYHR